MAFIIDAGEMDRRITIQRYNPAVKSRTGERIEEGWADLATCWARVRSAASREFWEAQAAHAELTHDVTIRYRAGITADMRLRFSGRVFDIVAPPVDPEDRHAFLILKCREVTT